MGACLVCVIHDPDEHSVEFIRNAKSTLERIYPEKYIAVSDQTSPVVFAELTLAGFKVRVVPKNGAGNARREALHFAWESNCDYFHYCDLDRILTWALRHSDELAHIGDSITQNEYTIIGRTRRAFGTHPESWIKTEYITNQICSLALGQEVDVTAGSCGFSRNALRLLMTHSKNQATDAEWIMIVHRIGSGSIGYKSVEGLEYVEEINGPTHDQSDANNWLKRLQISCIISESMLSTGN